MKKPNKPGEYASSPKDIAINTSSYNNVESPSDVSDFTLFDAVLRPSTVNNYVNFSKNPSNYLIYNSENGALIRNNRCEVVICSKNSLIFQADTDVSYVDIYQPTEIIYIETGSGMYINTFSDWSIQVNSAYNVELSAITDWSDKFIKLVSRNLYIKVKGYNSATYTLNVEFSTNGMLTSPDDIGATDGIITLVSKTKDLNSIFWKNVPVNKTSSFAIQLSSEDIDGNGTSIQFYDNTDWSNYSDWYSVSLQIYVGGWRVGNYNLATKEYTHISDRPIGDVHLLFDFDKSGGTGDGGIVSADNLSITFNNNDKIYLNKMSIGAQDGSAWELYSDEYYNLYYNSSRSNICTINDLKEKCYYPTKAFYDIVYYSSIYSEDPVLILEDIYSYTKNNLLIKDNGSNKLQLSNENNINDDAVFDEILTKQLPIINDYTSLGAIDSDFKFYTANTFEESVGDMSLSSTNIDSFSINSTVLDYKYYYIQFTPTGHIWKVHNRLSTLYLNNDNILSSFIQIKDLNGDTFLIRDSDGTEMSLSEAVKGKMVRKFKLEIDQDWNAAGEENALEIKNNGSDIFSVNKSGDISSRKLYTNSDIICSGDIYDKYNNKIGITSIFSNLSSIAGSFYNDESNNIFSRLIPENINGAMDIFVESVASLSSPRHSLAGFSINNYGYVAGGRAIASLDIAEKYNDILNSWSSIDSLNQINQKLSAFSLNDYGYAVGGFSSTITDKTEKYTPDIDSWTNTDTISSARYSISTFGLNGFGYVAGGTTGTGPVGTSEKYNDSSNVWATITSLTTGRRSSAGFSIDGFGYVAGGVSAVPSFLNTVEKYNDSSGLWSSSGSLNSIRIDSTAFVTNSFSYVAGGTTGSVVLSSIEKYNPSIDTWAIVSSLSESKDRLASFVCNDSGYMAGGYGSAGVGDFIEIVEKMNFGSKYYYLGKIFSSSNPPKEIYASHASEYFNNYGNHNTGYLDNIYFKYRTYSGDPSDDGNWTTGLTNDLSVPVSGFVDPATGTYDYEVKVAIPYQCSRLSWKPSGFNVWTTVDTLTVAVQGADGFSVNGFGYSAGGNSGSSTEKYNDALNSWTVVGSLTSATHFSCGFDLNTFGYSVGGWISSPLSTTEKYNDALDSWIASGSLNTARAYIAGFALGNFGYAAGGDTGAVSSIAEKYDDISDSWAYIDTLTSANKGAGGFALNDYGYITGGNTGTYSAITEKYDDALNSWTVVGSLNTARSYVIGFELNKFGYSAGGSNGSSSAVTEKYDGILDSWNTVDSLSTAKFGASGFALNEFGYVSGGNTGSVTNVTEKYADITTNWPKIKGFAIKIIE